MRSQYTYQTIAAKFVLCCTVLLASFTSKAQVLKNATTTSFIKDSLLAVGNKDFLYNTLTINNTSSNILDLQLRITIPEGWQMTTQAIVDVKIEPGTSTIVPMRLYPAASNSAAWQQVKIEYRSKATGEMEHVFFNVKMKEIAGFKATLPNANMVLAGYQRNIAVPIYIKNTGNLEGNYTVVCQNRFLHLDDKKIIKIEPGKDTVYNLKLTLSEREWNMMSKEEIRITVADGDAYNLSQMISKIGSVLKQHSSAYADMPLQVEAGAVYESSGETVNMQYYGGVYGSVDITEKDKVAVALRSNTFSTQGSNQNSIMRLDYTGEKLSVSAGNVIEMAEFMMDGYGGKVGYNWKDKNSISLFGIAKSRTGDSKTFGGNITYGLRENVLLSEEFTANIDNVEKLSAGIAKQKVFINLGENAKLDFYTGVSMEYSRKELSPRTVNPILGSSLGYNFMLNKRHLNIMSNVLYNSNQYAGTFKGQRAQIHDVRWVQNRFVIGGFYEYTLRKQTYFSDTMLINDAFNTQTSNFGARIGYSHKATNVLLSAGRQNQTQATDGAQVITTYDYLNLGTTLWFGNRTFINANSSIGYSTATNFSDKVLVSSTQATMQFKFLGIAARYDKGPYYYSEFMSYINKKQDYQRLLISPYLEASMFKKTLNLRAQYNYTESQPHGNVVSSVVMNVSYSNPVKGYDFNVNGVVPARKMEGTSNTYISASFRMRINAPCVAVKKYKSARIVMFKDANSNGIMDKGEEAIEGQMLTLNDNLFISDANGEVLYKNIDNKILKADFGYTSKIKGWAPAAGSMQNLDANGTQYVAFRKCKVLQGKISLVKDSTSNLKFNVAHIKVVVKGTDNSTYSTISDENGEFYFNLPTDNYTVTLSEAAFDENFRPSEFSQTADLTNNQEKTVYFEVRQKKRTMNIKKK